MSKTLGTLASSLCLLMVTGCGIGTTSGTGPTAPVGIPGAAIKGQVYGGQQPITGASVYLYAAGSTGYGSAYPYPNGASSMLGSNVVTTDANGNFNITNDYMCPSATTEVYLEAVGGSPDTNPADNNPNIVQIVALGPCGGLANMSFITMNELTTVASAYALAPFMAGPSNIGTSAANDTGITNAFATVNKLVNIQYGQINVNTVPSGATIPTAKLNTLADILASCVNQPHGGHAGDGTNCGTLFTDTTPPGGTAPTDTLSAAMNLAKYPGQFVSSLAGLASRMSPFQTIETSTPTDWTLTITYTASINGPGAVAADQLGNIWVVNNGDGSLVELTTNGSPAGPWMIGSVSPGPLAIDLVGDAWVGSTTANSLFEIAPGGAFGSVTGSGLGTTTSAIAIDGSGNIWAAGSGARLSEFSGSTHAPLSAAGYSGGGLSAAKSIAITPH